MASLVSLACSTERSLRLAAAVVVAGDAVEVVAGAAEEFFNRFPSYMTTEHSLHTRPTRTHSKYVKRRTVKSTFHKTAKEDDGVM